MPVSSLIEKVENYVFTLFKQNNSSFLVYHDFKHTYDVVEGVTEICKGENRKENDLEILKIAAWFHDVGFLEGIGNHEEKSVKVASEFLKKENVEIDIIEKVINCIEVTKLNEVPNNYLQEIIKDADLLSLGTKDYPLKSSMLRLENQHINKELIDDVTWIEKEVEFLKSVKYYTLYTQLNYSQGKSKNIAFRLEELSKLKKKKEELSLKVNKVKKADKSSSPDRGIETMFRTSLRNHMNLSAIADNKANLMLSINAIIISISISVLVPNYNSITDMFFPIAFLLSVCLVSIVLATLSTSPKFTTGKFTKEDVKNKKVNLLFFGNFHNMSSEDFEWGMKEMMLDRDYLYGSMIKDLHTLGGVLHKKYRYLRWTYMVFMYGIILSVILFGVILIISSPA